MLTRLLYQTLQADEERKRKLREQDAAPTNLGDGPAGASGRGRSSKRRGVAANSAASSSHSSLSSALLPHRARRGGVRTDATSLEIHDYDGDQRGGGGNSASPAGRKSFTHNLNILRRRDDPADGADSAAALSSSSADDDDLQRQRPPRESVGTNDGQAFGFAKQAERQRLSTLFNAPSGGALLMRGFDISGEAGAPNVPHKRQASSSRGAIAALFAQRAAADAVAPSTTNELQAQQQQQQAVYATTSAVVSEEQNQQQFPGSSLPVSWVRALRVAARNIERRGGERASDDIEACIAALLQSRRRRQAYELFAANSDVPLSAAAYDQLLRVFVADRDRCQEIFAAMERHAVLQHIIRRGERTSVAQAVFEALSLHNWERALLAFEQHSSSGAANAALLQQQPSDSAAAAASASTPLVPPVYSGLLVALLRRGLRDEAMTLVGALRGSDTQRDIATGLIRCLQAESESSSSSSSSSSAGATHPLPRQALEFTNAWLEQQEQQQRQDQRQAEDGCTTRRNVDFFEALLRKSDASSINGGEHAAAAVRVFARHANPFTCTAVAKFLLSASAPSAPGTAATTPATTRLLSEAIALSLFASQHSQQAQSQHQQQRQYNLPPTASAVADSISSFLRLGYYLPGQPASVSAAAAEAVMHLARVSVARSVVRSNAGAGSWAVALSMAQQCLRARAFDPVPPLAGAVARSGRWAAALRLGTQLLALRRTQPTAAELSLCTHASLRASKWSSALFFVERAHTAGLRVDPAVYDAVIAMMPGSRHGDVVRYVAQPGGATCSSASIERLLSAAAEKQQEGPNSSEAIVHALIDQDVVDWRL